MQSFLARATQFLSLALIGLSSHVCHATESDPYSLADIALEDSSEKINDLVNGAIRGAIGGIRFVPNQMPSADAAKNIEIELVSRMREFGGKGYSFLFIHNLEACIYLNDCKGVPKFERVVLEPGESIFAESDYTTMTGKNNVLSPIINLCGTRIGADKLTHIFNDGLRFYNAWQTDDLSLAQLWEKGNREELTLNGRTASQVYSSADIQANLIGVEIYQSLLFGDDPLVCVDQAEGRLRMKRQLDICKYVNVGLDETVNINTYTNASKLKALRAAIQKRIQDPNPKRLSREEVLARKGAVNSEEDLRLDTAKDIFLNTFVLDSGIRVENLSYLQLIGLSASTFQQLRNEAKEEVPMPRRHLPTLKACQ